MNTNALAFEVIRRERADGSEYSSDRVLASILGYENYHHQFLPALTRVRSVCKQRK